MAREINPKDTTRASAYELWMKAPNPMVTFFKTLDVTNLIRVSKRQHLKFNMMLDYCIGKAAVGVKEFYVLPVGEKLIQYDTIAVNTIVKNKEGEVSSCDIPYSDDLETFRQEYIKYTTQVAETGQDRDLSSDSMVIGTSAIVDTEIDGAVGMNSGIFNNPFIIWGRYNGITSWSLERNGSDTINCLSVHYYNSEGGWVTSGNILDHANFTTYVTPGAIGALPISGGTLTGSLTISSNSILTISQMNLGNVYLYTDSTGSFMGRTGLENGYHYFNFNGSDGNLYLDGNIVLNAANYTSYTVTKTGSGASGTWGINISGSAASANSVAWANVSGKPGFATVATSGNYNDLTNKPSIPAALGFTPVQQGGGSGQQANKIYIGWSGTQLKAQVDSTDMGTLVRTGTTIAIGSATQPVYIAANGVATACSYTLGTSVPSNAVFTDTKDWASITGKPSEYTPAAHNHTLANITNISVVSSAPSAPVEGQWYLVRQG